MIKDIQDKFNNILKKMAKKNLSTLNEYVEEKRIQIAEKLLNKYNLQFSLVGLIIPTLVTFIPLILPQTSDNNLIQFILNTYAFILFIFFIISLPIILIKINIWKEVCFLINEEHNQKLKDETNSLKGKIKVLENEKNRLKRMHTILNILIKRIKENQSNKHLSQIIAQDILTMLNSEGKYSVAIYEQYKNIFWMPCYETNMDSYNAPKLYENGVTKITSNIYKDYFSYKCLQEKNDVTNFLKSKAEIAINFHNASAYYNQYASCGINISKSHKILLELISYEDKKFDHDDNFQEYMVTIFDLYVPLLRLIFSIDASLELKNLS